jgi:hypothetical protein
VEHLRSDLLRIESMISRTVSADGKMWDPGAWYQLGCLLTELQEIAGTGSYEGHDLARSVARLRQQADLTVVSPSELTYVLSTRDSFREEFTKPLWKMLDSLAKRP